jgi:hypothetical protein
MSNRKQETKAMEILIIVLLALGAVFTLMHLVSGEGKSFIKNITIEECKNVSIENGTRQVNFLVNISAENYYSLGNYNCNILYMIKFNNASYCFVPDNTCEYSIINTATITNKWIENLKLYTGEILNIPHVDNYTVYTYLVKMQFQDYKNESICTTKEVDEIFTQEAVKCTGESYTRHCQFNQVESIKKSEIKKEWLESNCKCETYSGHTAEDVYAHCIYGDSKCNDCPKYRCFDMYTIEVNK